MEIIIFDPRGNHEVLEYFSQVAYEAECEAIEEILAELEDENE